MRTPNVRRLRAPVLAPVLAGVALAGVAAGTAAPAVAAATPAHRVSEATAPPPLDAAMLSRAIAGLPDDTLTGAMVRVSGSAGHWSGTSGVADIDTGRPVPSDGRFRIGSATKVFTAVVTLQLDAEHRIDVDQPVQRYLPGLLPADYPTITVGELLNHTSGLADPDLPSGDARWYVQHRFDYTTPEQIVEASTSGPPAYQPGTQQRYSGVGYYVLGMLIEKVTGHSYADEVNNRILRPLGLRHTFVPGRYDVDIPGPHAHGYVSVDGTLVDVSRQSADGWAEGGMISTTADLTRLLTAVFQGRLLPPAQQARMFAVPDVPYTKADSNCRIDPNAGRACFTMGLTRTELPNGLVLYGKSGSVDGYTTAVFGTPDLARVLVYSLNPTGHRDGSEGRYVQQIVAAAFAPELAARASATSSATSSAAAPASAPVR